MCFRSKNLDAVITVLFFGISKGGYQKLLVTNLKKQTNQTAKTNSKKKKSELTENPNP